MTYPTVRITGLPLGARFRTGRFSDWVRDTQTVTGKPTLVVGEIPNITLRQDGPISIGHAAFYEGGGLTFTEVVMPSGFTMDADGNLYPDYSALISDQRVEWTVSNSAGSRTDSRKVSIALPIIESQVTYDGVGYTVNVEPGQTMEIDLDGDDVVDLELTPQQTTDLESAPQFGLPPRITLPVEGEKGNAVGQTLRLSPGIIFSANANPTLTWSATRLSDSVVLATEADGDFLDYAVTAADQGQTIRITATADDDGAGGPTTETRDIYVLADGEQPNLWPDIIATTSPTYTGRTGTGISFDPETQTILTQTTDPGRAGVQFIGVLDPAKTYVFSSESSGDVAQWRQAGTLIFDPVTGDCPPTQITGVDTLLLEVEVNAVLSITLNNTVLREVV